MNFTLSRAVGKRSEMEVTQEEGLDVIDIENLIPFTEGCQGRNG
jgi:hypothetical protein